MTGAATCRPNVEPCSRTVVLHEWQKKEPADCTYASVDVGPGSGVRDRDGDDHVQCKVLGAKAGLDLGIDLHARPAQLAYQWRHLHSQPGQLTGLKDFKYPHTYSADLHLPNACKLHISAGLNGLLGIHDDGKNSKNLES